jgi:hypothetical protein
MYDSNAATSICCHVSQRNFIEALIALKRRNKNTMIINSELLKEAIADAKAVRATALANAKASLEEAFAPRFEAMFADKLKGDSEEENMVAEVEAPNQVSGTGGEAKGPKTKAVSQGEPKKVSDAASNFKTVAIGGKEGAAGSKAPAATQSIVKETAEEDEEDVEKVDENAEAGLTTEDLDAIIKELEAEVAGEEEGVPTSPTAASAPLPENPAGAVVPQLPCAPAPVDGSVPSLKGGAPAPIVPPSPEAGAAPVAPAPIAPAPEAGAEGQPSAKGDDEEINLEELLAALNEEAEKDEEEDDKEKMDEMSNNGVPTNVGGQDKAPKTTSNKDIEATKTPNTKGEIGSGEVGGKPKLEEATKYKVALKEAYDTIGFLRGQINEVNLLNAKLLYTNKLFKEFAQVLDDTYRMKIVENFDLTKSVREVKLAYALLAESLSFGSRSSSKTLVTKPVVKKTSQITEGLASKPVASTKPSKELLSEGSEMATRFQKLAGIKPQAKK